MAEMEQYKELPVVLTVKELAKFLRLGLNTVYALLKTGKIKSVRVGRQYRIPREALMEYLETKKESCA